MNKEVINAKLESLRRCIERIKEKTPTTAAALLEDIDLQDIISVNLERAIQLCVDISSHIIAATDMPAPSTMGESFEQLRRLDLISGDLAAHMKKTVGFRNIAVHAYHEINWAMVYSIVTTQISDFVEFAQAVSKHANLP
jgi:uncharacterized protein YutE (UPF0331/DUF86 family)